ncbi:MAG TPA: amidohydrolase family protein, partial [Bacillota bacterium]
MSLLIKNARFLIQDARTIAEQADLLVSGNRIAAVGRDLDAPPEATVIDATGRVVMPGFVNAHTHLYQTLLRGRRDDLPLQEWLAEVIFPFTNEIQAGAKNGETEIGYCWSMLGALEMVRGGITACINMDKTLPSVFEAWQDLGFRGVGALNAANQWIPPELMIGDAERKAEILRYVDRWHGAGADALIDVCLAPSTAYACTPDFFRWLVETAACRRLWFHIHVSETPWDVTFCREHYGLTPLAYLDTLGLLDHHVTAAHCVFLTGEEIALAARKGVVPVYNPKSNAKLGNGVAPIVEMLAAGMTVALGTDGPASNDSMDLFEEMRAAAMLQKVHHR